MDQPMNASLLYAVSLLASLAYWLIFLGVRATFRRLFPRTYDQLRQDTPKKLMPVIVMVVRMMFGLTMSLPACIVAGVTTPWGYGQGLNTAGQMCVVSQGVVWVTELQAMMDFSVHLMTHHIICAAVMANIILAPNIHQIKPLYIFLASQLGDAGPGTILIMKILGKRPSNSPLLRYIVMVSTGVIILSKTVIHLWGFGIAFQTPHRVGDWLWGICLFFFGIYCLEGAHKNLTWIGVFKAVPKPAGLVIADKVQIPLLDLYLGLASLSALVFSVFVYSLNLDRALQDYEVAAAWLACSTVLASGTAVLFLMNRPSKSRAELPQNYSRTTRDISIFCQSAAALLSVFSLITQSTNGGIKIPLLDTQVGLAALSLGMLLWETIIRAGNWISTKKEIKQTGREEVVEKANAELMHSRLKRLHRKAAFHLAMASFSMAIPLCVYFIPARILTFVEKGRVALGAHAMAQFIGEVNMRSNSVKTTSSARGNSESTSTTIRVLPAVVELVLAGYSISYEPILRLVVEYSGPAFVALALASSGSVMMRRMSSSKTSRCISRTLTRRLMDPMHFTVLLTALLQVVVMKEVLAQPDYNARFETSTGFRNLRVAIQSLPTIPTLIAMGMLHWAARDVARTQA